MTIGVEMGPIHTPDLDSATRVARATTDQGDQATTARGDPATADPGARAGLADRARFPQNTSTQ
jgi:hypothetical protein